MTLEQVLFLDSPHFLSIMGVVLVGLYAWFTPGKLLARVMWALSSMMMVSFMHEPLWWIFYFLSGGLLGYLPRLWLFDFLVPLIVLMCFRRFFSASWTDILGIACPYVAYLVVWLSLGYPISYMFGDTIYSGVLYVSLIEIGSWNVLSLSFLFYLHSFRGKESRKTAQQKVVQFGGGQPAVTQ